MHPNRMNYSKLQEGINAVLSLNDKVLQTDCLRRASKGEVRDAYAVITRNYFLQMDMAIQMLQKLMSEQSEQVKKIMEGS